jgi:hypothetical protein
MYMFGLWMISSVVHLPTAPTGVRHDDVEAGNMAATSSM